ncbi:MAG: TonB-dependent receptor [Opitutaceae bacterium]
MKSNFRRIQILGTSSLFLTTLATAQEGSEAEFIALEAMKIEYNVPPEERILPTTRPFVSVYGTERNILDTPRNVTIISREQLDAISIKDPRDFAKLTSSSYTGSNFGAPTTPSIRGQVADTLINGMRKGLSNNGNGLPLNWNSVESVNILKGPPSVMVGASQYVGGYVDLITKKPTFDEDSGFLTLTLDTEGLRKAQLDQNLIISEDLAVRFSLTGEDTTDYYWDDFKRQTTAIYGALTWAPEGNYRLELNGEYFNANYTENWGLNRVTQDLLDHNIYVTGGPGTTSGFLDSVTPTGTTTISRTKRLHGEGDDSNGEYLSLQAIQTFTPSSDVSFVNNSLFQYRDRDTYSAYQYSEIFRDNFRFENRTEARTSIELFDTLHSLNLGLVFSYQDVYAVNDYYHEPANAWDLANQTYDSIGVTDADVFLDPFSQLSFVPLNAFPIYGEAARGKLSYRPGSTAVDYFFPNVPRPAGPAATGLDVLGNGDSNDSQTTTLSFFLQDDTKLTEKLSLLVGGRLDYVYSEAEDPQFDNLITYLKSSEVNNGLGYSDAELSGVEKAQDAHSDFVPNFNVGLLYKFTETKSIYANYNYSESIPLGSGGGVPLDQATGKYDGDAFDIKSELVEAGFKATFLDSTLFYSANVYYQTRTDQQSQGQDQVIESSGFETEINYQPSKKVHLSLGYSYIDATSNRGTIAAAQPISATGGPYSFSQFYTFSGYDANLPGVPNHIFNGLLAYQLTDKLTATISFLVTSEMDTAFNVPAAFALDTFGNPSTVDLVSARIDWQYSIDLGLKYETDQWAFTVNALNVTGEENWGAVSGLYGNDSVFAELPFRLEFGATYKW